jgi:hypothetical protein
MLKLEDCWQTAKNWTDRVLDDDGHLLPEYLVWVCGLPVMLTLAVETVFNVDIPVGIWVLAIAVAVALTIFWLWRFGIQITRVSRNNARHYDSIGKHELPPEYADTESSEAAKRRRKRKAE